MKLDYPELEGKIITWGEDKIPAKVIGCSYHVGITIVELDDTNHKLTCLNRKDALKGRYKQFPNTYRQMFQTIVKMIQEGHYDLPRSTGGGPERGCMVSTCSWEE